VKEHLERTFWYTLARVLGRILTHTICPMVFHNVRNYNISAPFIVLSNHRSAFDPLAIALPCKRYELRIIGKSELGKHPIAHYVLEKLHMISINRHETDIAAIRISLKLLNEGKVLGIFPEGTRYQPALMHEVQTGIAMLALRSQVPLLPVYIHQKIKIFHITHVYIGAPIVVDDLYGKGIDSETISEVIQRIRTTFSGLEEAAK
jgi:1-acyl-sn-glycerol-3-phosphate acyltransferase